MRPVARVYESIAKAFGSSDLKKLLAEAHEAHNVLDEVRLQTIKDSFTLVKTTNA